MIYVSDFIDKIVSLISKDSEVNLEDITYETNVSSILSKLEIFNDKSKYLDLIIKNNINNLEIRFLRYCLQKKSPSFLGYNKELDIDYKFILRNINNHPQETQDYIYSTIRSL